MKRRPGGVGGPYGAGAADRGARAARFGLLGQAPVVITQGAHLPQVGLLLALPALEATGLLEVAEQTYGPMRNGFYGLRVTLLMGVFMALLREPRAEGATRLRPVDLGRLLGLDRAPEVKTLRRKLTELAEHRRGAAAAGRARSPPRRDPTRGGGVPLPRRTRPGLHRAPGSSPRPTSPGCGSRARRPRRPGSATVSGDPIMVLTAAPSKSLAAELSRLLPDLRRWSETTALHGHLRPGWLLPGGVHRDPRRRVRHPDLLQGHLGPVTAAGLHQRRLPRP